ncbi:huntingtin-interacting protein K [Anopheles aquasalis]|uniref:Nascent polypeptide-associated complex subunit alpha-like UBA domain-containing protein n=4 Tax=Nyssorhynchus TaxID=44543 RepID=T1DNZ1_ANOAQ|nr:huntingtin-interacting protein K [Anopheles aquasalis]
MADPESVNGVDDANDKKQKKSSKHDSGAADLERVTDYAEEKEITSHNLCSNAANLFEAKRNKENAEKLAKERELQKVQVKKEDIELIIREIETTRSKAEQTLREHRGDLVAALEALTN